MFKKIFKGSFVSTLIMDAADAIDLANELQRIMKNGRYTIETIDNGQAVVTLLMKSERDYKKLIKKLSAEWETEKVTKDGTLWKK